MNESAAELLMASLDSFDRRILALLQRDNQRTFTAIGEAVGLSPSAVRRRVDRLRRDKVIAGDVSLVNPETLGITVIISVRFEKESHATYEAFKKQMRSLPEVAQCYTVSGDVDFIVIAHLPDLPSYDDWIGRHLLSNAALARSDTNIVYSRVKFETAIPVGEDGSGGAEWRRCGG